MSKRRLVNRCLMGAVLAVPATLFGIYSLGFAEDPPIADFPAESELRPILRLAQADGQTQADHPLQWLDLPGGVAVGKEDAKDLRESVGVGSCIRCHAAKSSVNQQLLGFDGIGDNPSDDNWALLNEAATWANADKHHGAYAALFNERSQQMAKVLGIVDENGKSLIHRDVRCIACHSGIPLQELEMDAAHAGLITDAMVSKETLNRGVSCEGCHGVAGETNTYEGWETEHISKRRWRFMDPKIKAEKYGYFDIRSPVARTRMCLSCHLGNVREGRVVTHEMFAAGHPPLPGFELETFSFQEPQHWRNFHEKAKDVRDEFLERTKKRQDPETKETVGWRTTEWREDDLHNTRDLLIGSLINLSEMMRLTLDMADPNVTVAVGGENWSRGTEGDWPEFAVFACYACHNDLQDQGWRLKRKPIGTPGRPPLHEWPFVLAKFAIQSTGGGQPLLDQIREVQEASVDGPFGNKKRLMTEGRKLIGALDAYAAQLETMPLPKSKATEFLNGLVEIAQNEQHTIDYDSARQLVWAFRVIYEDAKDISLSDEQLYVNKPLDERKGWYDPNAQDLDPVQKGLAEFSNVMLMDLREGSREDQSIGGAQRPFLQWDASLALPPIGDYDPERFRAKLSELNALIQKNGLKTAGE